MTDTLTKMTVPSTVVESREDVEGSADLGLPSAINVEKSDYNSLLQPDRQSTSNITGETVFNLVKPPPFVHVEEPIDGENATSTPGEIIVDKSGNLLLKYLTEKGVMNDAIEGFNMYVQVRIEQILASRKIIFTTKNNVDPLNQSYFTFANIRIERPVKTTIKADGTEIETPLLPRLAREEKRTYRFQVLADIEYRDTNNKLLQTASKIRIFAVPALLGSVVDYLLPYIGQKEEMLKLGECAYDPLGYFIIKGEEKIILIQSKLRTKQQLIYNDQKGDIVSVFTSESIRGQTVNNMYQDNDKTIRFFYMYLARIYKGGTVVVTGKRVERLEESQTRAKNKGIQSINVLQIFRILGREVPKLEFDDPLNIIIYIVSFVEEKYKRKVLIELQASYVDILSRGDDYNDVYERSKLKVRWKASKAKRESRKKGKLKKRDGVMENPISPSVWVTRTRKDILKGMIELVFSHITVDHITPSYIREKMKQRPHLNFRQIEKIELSRVIKSKIILLGVTTARYAETLAGMRIPDDRDAMSNIRLLNGGKMMEQLTRQMWDDTIDRIVTDVQRVKSPTANYVASRMRAYSSNIDVGFENAFTPNNWGPPGESRTKQENITDRLDRGQSLVAVYSHLLRINTPTNRRVQKASIRAVKARQIGYIDALETPSSKAIGLVENKAITCWISVERELNTITQIIIPHLRTKSEKAGKYDSLVLLNGNPVGWSNAVLARTILLTARRRGQIDFDVSIVIDDGILHVNIDAGRPTRPLLIVNRDGIPLIEEKKMWTNSFDEILKAGLVEYLDPWELEMHTLIASSLYNITFLREDLNRNRNLLKQLEREILELEQRLKTYTRPPGLTEKEVEKKIGEMDADLVKYRQDNNNDPTAMWLWTTASRNALKLEIERVNKNIGRMEKKIYTHVEMDPTAILGLVASTTPLIDRNPGPRNVFQCGMMRQAFGINYSNPSLRFPTTDRFLSYPSRPLLATQMQTMLGIDNLPSGNTIILAILTTDDNEEDAITIKKEAIRRGLFTYTLYHSSNLLLTKFQFLAEKEPPATIQRHDRLVKPVKPLPGHVRNNYNNIDEQGLPIPDSAVKTGDCLIGAARRIVRTELGISTTSYEDISVYVKDGEGGIIDKVLVARTGSGQLSVTVRVRKTGQPVVSDKVATRQAQKSTIGRIVPEAELPFTKDGIIPDIFLNPHAIPKRMTIATLIEIVVSKYAALAGERINGTIFRPFELDSFMELLSTLYGYNMYGTETLYSPISGETYPSQIMVGPSYYQLLKHQVSKKIQARGEKGPRSLVTGQALGGRKRKGGIRFGGSEAKSVLAHGAVHFLRDRMHTASDPFRTAFCKECNKTSIMNVIRERAACTQCGSNNIGSCVMPRVFNSMVDMIATAGIRTELFTGKGVVPETISKRVRRPTVFRLSPAAGLLTTPATQIQPPAPQVKELTPLQPVAGPSSAILPTTPSRPLRIMDIDDEELSGYLSPDEELLLEEEEEEEEEHDYNSELEDEFMSYYADW